MNKIIILFFLSSIVCNTYAQSQKNPSIPTPDLNGSNETLKKIKGREAASSFVAPGTEKEATDYYERISLELSFGFFNSTLDSFLSYLGYSSPKIVDGITQFKGLLAKDFEKIDSFTLMPRNDGEFSNLSQKVDDSISFESLFKLSDFQDEKVLVSRFFAPKISTYYNVPPNDSNLDEFDPLDSDSIKPGWRKLVRLKPKKDSAGDKAGIEHVYLLFNVKKDAADADADPYFENESGNNQIIIVPKVQSKSDAIYFGVYQGQGQDKTKEYPIGLFLEADFDLPGHVTRSEPGAEDGKFFIPRSCAECHGHSFSDPNGINLRGYPVDENGKLTKDFLTGKYKFAKPNYLDTDQWYDWMEFDYRKVSGSLNDVIFDGGKDHGSEQYSRAFEVFKILNKDIKDETFAAEKDPGVKSFQTLAVEKWRSLHSNDNLRKPYSVRSIGVETWNSEDKDEMRLLRLLNNHCFRCHSSLRYNVFDKKEVRRLKFPIIGNLQSIVTNGQVQLPGYFMPQGRVLEDGERKEIIELIKQVFDN